MGVAAYNRGSKLIRDQFAREAVERTRTIISIGAALPAGPKADDPLPEGRLRSSFLPEGDANGTALFLEYSNRWYTVGTRFETLKRSRTLQKAISAFERLEMYGLCALQSL